MIAALGKARLAYIEDCLIGQGTTDLYAWMQGWDGSDWLILIISGLRLPILVRSMVWIGLPPMHSCFAGQVCMMIAFLVCVGLVYIYNCWAGLAYIDEQRCLRQVGLCVWFLGCASIY